MLNSRRFNPAFLLISFLRYRDAIEAILNLFSVKYPKANEPPKYYKIFLKNIAAKLKPIAFIFYIY